MICANAKAVTSTIKVFTKSTAEITRLLQPGFKPNDRPRCQSTTHQSPVVTHVSYAKDVLERPAILELQVLNLLGLLIKLDSPLIDVLKMYHCLVRLSR